MRILRHITGIATCILLFAAYPKAHAQTNADARIGNALNGGDPFELKNAYVETSDSLTPLLKCFAECMLANNFNRPAEACSSIDTLVEKYQDAIGLENTMTMLYLKASNMAKLGHYEDASQMLGSMVQQLAPHIDKSKLALFSEKADEYAALAKFGGINEASIPSCGATFPFAIDSTYAKNNITGRIFFTADINGHQLKVNFDTGAGTNVISEQAAKMLGLHMLDAKVTAMGISGMKRNGYKAIADKVKIGDLEIRNVPFLVMDIKSGVDSIDNKYFKNLDAIMGVELMDAVKEMRIDFKAQNIHIPSVPSPMAKGEKQNLAINNTGISVVEAAIGGTPYTVGFDTGASNSVLSALYYERNKNFILANCEEDSVRQAGSGGIEISKAYKLNDVAIAVGGGTHVFPHISSLTDSNSTDGKYGNLGMDYFRAFDEVVINMKDMFVRMISCMRQ